jgi:release factor glutamine methyltransferase
MTNLSQFLAEIAARFQTAGIESFQADAETLIGFSLGISRGELQAKAFLGESFEVSEELQELIERRSRREPLQHLTGVAHFRKLSLAVGPGVFIPRPETESVVSIALEQLQGISNARVLDIGTGSGAIAISIATEANLQVDAIELSDDAARFTLRNINSN